MSVPKWSCLVCTFENAISSKRCEMCEMRQSPDLPVSKGVVGLRNLGKTSYINSIIQCLVQTPYFTQYVLNNDYMNHINKQNPLGFGGQIAKIWGDLVKNILSGKYAIFDPTEFQTAIKQIAPRFSNNEQHDAKEMLSFLLTALHEDLNKIINKPLTQYIDSENKSDQIISTDSWNNYLKRNDSIIIDQFTAQYKSMVLCPDCNYCSNTFIPYNILSIPIATEKYKIIEYTFIDSDTSIKPTVYGQKMLKTAGIDMLKETVSKSIITRYKKQELYERIISYGYIRECEINLTQIIPNDVIELFCDYYVFIHPYPIKKELFVVAIKQSKIERELRQKLNHYVTDIDIQKEDIFIYHSPRPNPDDFSSASFQTFVVNNQHRVIAPKRYGAPKRYTDEPIGFPLLATFPMNVHVTIKQIYNMLWTLIKPFYLDEFNETDDNLPFQFWAIWGLNNHAKIRYDDGDVFDLNKRNLKFLIHWKDPNKYNSSLYPLENRIRDPSSVGLNVLNVLNDDSKPKTIELTKCIESFCEETEISDTSWRCPKCKDVKQAIKKIDLWNVPNTLIIHLQRFINTINSRDFIDTLVQYPLKGLDLSSYLLSNTAKKEVIYDLYAITNYIHDHDGNDGGYCANTKNLYNSEWYYFNDVNTAKIHSTNTLISAEAYILYYHKRK